MVFFHDGTSLGSLTFDRSLTKLYDDTTQLRIAIFLPEYSFVLACLWM